MVIRANLASKNRQFFFFVLTGKGCFKKNEIMVCLMSVRKFLNIDRLCGIELCGPIFVGRHFKPDTKP
jgi:hypothetical protein